jgi:hypothetical protein
LFDFLLIFLLTPYLPFLVISYNNSHLSFHFFVFTSFFCCRGSEKGKNNGWQYYGGYVVAVCIASCPLLLLFLVPFWSKVLALSINFLCVLAFAHGTFQSLIVHKEEEAVVEES